MMNRLFNKEDYEITLDDFKKEMDKALQTLVGIDVMKNGGIGKLVKDATADVMFGCIECDNTLVKTFCPALGDDHMETFGQVFFTYRPDKRTYDKTGTRIETIEFRYTFDTSKVDEYVCNISQVLSYDFAEVRKKDLEAQVKEMEAKIAEYKKHISKFDNIMRTEKYR